MKKLHIKTSKKYPILIGSGVIGQIEPNCEHVVIISDRKVAKLYAVKLQNILKRKVKKVDLLTFPAGEKSKNIINYESLQNSLLKLGADTETVLLALGGGVVGDMTGFVAATYMRGIRFIQVPTTLLAAVDSSIGGKTGVDLAVAKNVIGAFWHPEAVYIDLEFLESLPIRQFSSGLAEIIKAAIIADAKLFNLLEKISFENLRTDKKLLEKVIYRSIKVKQKLVEKDERDTGQRHLLNFGHTIGHALEAQVGYGKISHGEAVAVGMFQELNLTKNSKELSLRLLALLESFRLPNLISKDISIEELLRSIRHDKKKKDVAIDLILIPRLGQAKIKSFKISKSLIKKLMT